VLEAEYHLNRNWHLGGDICVNDFYDFLGIEHIDCGDELGWYWSDGIDWIDFNHHKTAMLGHLSKESNFPELAYKTVLDDGLEVYVIDMAFSPSINDDPFA
jgi:hypothetical protein